MTALLIDDGTLLVHYVVVLEQALTHAEMVLLDLLLGALNALRDHRTLNHLAFLEAKTVHDAGNTLAGKQTHELVFKRDVED